ncbi:hypothetical protein Ahy_A05g023391 [Arachis hypogaea]|uniref:Uncharacterized protein n=1 Tax=Arachis hypogaea TaxID=3818 RepID=A0A445D3W2_ARAHY|nr:hypothetical protein Ahy_A05g023391 [Arachis hypogaea]
MFSSANVLSLLSSGKTTFPRSGLSFLIISAHFKASLVKCKVWSIGQSEIAGSSTSSKVPLAMALLT